MRFSLVICIQTASKFQQKWSFCKECEINSFFAFWQNIICLFCNLQYNTGKFVICSNAIFAYICTSISMCACIY